MTTLVAQYSAVLLDVDGVLVDTEHAVVALWGEVCERLGRSTPAEQDRQHIVGCSVEHTTGHLFPQADRETVLRIRALVEELEPDLPVTEVPGAAALVRELHARGVPIALVTGASSDRLDRVLQVLDVEPYVTATVTWGQSEGKPHPGPYLLAASRLGVRSDDCVVVEDAVAGVRSAVAARAACIGLAVPESPGGRALIEAGAVTVLGTLRDVAVALRQVKHHPMKGTS